MSDDGLTTPIARHIWESKYRYTEDFPFSAYQSVFEQVYALGLKGCTAFRPNPVTGAILASETGDRAPVHCCDIDREPA